MSSLFLVHAVLGSGRALPEAPSPVTGAELQLIEEGELSALVSVLPAGAAETLFADHEASAEIAMRHHALLTKLALTIDLAPVRLGAVYAGEHAVRQMLAEGAKAFQEVLDRIAKSSEFAVKLTPLAAAETAPSEENLTGRGFLQRRSDAAARQRNRAERAREIASRVFEIVAAQSKDHVFASPRRNAQADQEKRLLDAALLVPRAQLARFEEVVTAAQALAEGEGYRLTVTGPLPAYSFVASKTDRELAA